MSTDDPKSKSAERRQEFEFHRRQTRDKLDAMREATRDSRPEISEELVEEISGIHEGLDELAEQIKHQAKPVQVIVAEKPNSSRPPSLRGTLRKLGFPRWLSWTIAALVAVATTAGAIVRACEEVPIPHRSGGKP